MPDALRDLQVLAVYAAREALEAVDYDWDKRHGFTAYRPGPSPDMAALRALTLARIGEEAAKNLIRLKWTEDPDPHKLAYSSTDLASIYSHDPQSHLVVRDVEGWPTVMRRELQFDSREWPWPSPDGLRSAAEWLELMIRREVFERGMPRVGGPVYRLSDWIWTSLRFVAQHLKDPIEELAIGAAPEHEDAPA